MRILLCIVLGVFSYLLGMPPNSAQSTNLQDLIDATAEGGILHLQEGVYKGNFIIQKPISIIAEGNVVITSERAKEPIFTIENSRDVSIAGLDFTSASTAVKVKNTENITLSQLNLTNVFNGIEVFESENLDINNISIIGKGEQSSHSGNGISVYTSNGIKVKNNKISKVQDGVYIEDVKNIIVSGNEVANSRYGTHFMYSENADITRNRFSKNVTGLMIMMAENIQIENNSISYQDGFNGTGITLYDTKAVDLIDNLISGSRIGLTIQKTSNVHAISNIFQMNQTAVESLKSELSNQLSNNKFIGNIVNCRTDEMGIHLNNNYYDDYSGIDVNDDGIGDDSYVAFQSFGQWMVRKPVYQYYVESPSVVLLNQIDQQINKGSKVSLVDKSPLTNKNIKQNNERKVNSLQLAIGISLLVLCLIIWRRSAFT